MGCGQTNRPALIRRTGSATQTRAHTNGIRRSTLDTVPSWHDLGSLPQRRGVRPPTQIRQGWKLSVPNDRRIHIQGGSRQKAPEQDTNSDTTLQEPLERDESEWNVPPHMPPYLTKRLSEKYEQYQSATLNRRICPFSDAYVHIWDIEIVCYIAIFDVVFSEDSQNLSVLL